MLVRTFVFVGLILIAAVSLVAQHSVFKEDFVFFNHAVHSIGFDMPEEALQKAKTALNLSDVQITAVQALFRMRTETTHEIFQDVEAARTKLHDLANQSANATEIGTA